MAGEALVVSFAAEAVLNKLASMLSEEINLASGLKEDLKTLCQRSKIILALLRDAEKCRLQQQESVLLWLNNMKDAVYHADDVLDAFAFEMLRRKVEIQNRKKRNKARNFLSVSNNPVAFHFKIAHKVKDVNIALDRVVEHGIKLGLNQALDLAVESPSGTISNHQRQQRQTHPFVDDSKVLGREDDKSKVVNMLLQPSHCDGDDDQDLSVVAVVGLAGLGKTTLAQLIYKDEGVKRHFDDKIWLCVPDDFSVTRLVKEMAGSLMINIEGEKPNIEAMIHEVKKKLEGRKLLLVLDDVWNTDANVWESFKNSLLGIDASKGSKILVTTRSARVASTMAVTVSTHHLAGLSEEVSWSLFRVRAFASGGGAGLETPYLVDVGKRMLKRCKGVPLAIKTLGALMHSKEEREWAIIEGSELWDLSNDESGIMSALKLSFNNLPSPFLKQCFAYCAIFPKDTVFEKDDLIQLWIAQGFIHSSQESNKYMMEDTGNDYFKILLWNSFFQDAEMDEYGNLQTFKMHDLVHDLAQSISKPECSTIDSHKVNNSIGVQHLSLIPCQLLLPINQKENVAQLRTLFSIRNFPIDLKNFKCLRVLNLQDSYMDELPNSIGKFKHLRYLNVSNTRIKAFPECIAKLYNLQTLVFKGCREFEVLPRELRSLINLRHLCFDPTYRGSKQYQTPIEIGRLSSLQTLPCFVVGHEKGRQIEELGSLTHLRGELEITKLECVKDSYEAKMADLMSKTGLWKLRLAWSSSAKEQGDNTYEDDQLYGSQSPPVLRSWEDGHTDEDVLAGLQPPPNLKSLTIEDFMGSKFPLWMMMSSIMLPGNLVEIRLTNCRKCERIPTLGELPFLKFLEVRGMDSLSCIGTEFYSSYGSSNDGEGASTSSSSSYDNGGTKSQGSTFFPALEIFMLTDMANLVEWTGRGAEGIAEFVVFPCLEELTISGCGQLAIAPTHFPSLRKLSIENVQSGAPIATMSNHLTTLTSLSIVNASQLTCLPEQLLQNNKHLTYIQVFSCEMLTSISPDVGLQNLMSLEELIIDYCPKLPSIQSVHGLTSLRRLMIRSCDEMTNLPKGLGSCTSLEELTVFRCPSLISVPKDNLKELKSLSSLSISECEKLRGLPLGGFLHCLTQLKTCYIGGFWKELDSFPFDINVNHIQQLHHLKFLTLHGWPKVKSLPDQLQHLTTLHELTIFAFDGIEALPEWLGSLNLLVTLNVKSCENLKYLPSEQSMRQLSDLTFLNINQCPLLKERFNKGSGLEPSKISHVPYVYIDYDEFQSPSTDDDIYGFNVNEFLYGKK